VFINNGTIHDASIVSHYDEKTESGCGQLILQTENGYQVDQGKYQCILWEAKDLINTVGISITKTNGCTATITNMPCASYGSTSCCVTPIQTGVGKIVTGKTVMILIHCIVGKGTFSNTCDIKIVVFGVQYPIQSSHVSGPCLQCLSTNTTCWYAGSNPGSYTSHTYFNSKDPWPSQILNNC
jgi:hypothetical protein